MAMMWMHAAVTSNGEGGPRARAKLVKNVCLFPINAVVQRFGMTMEIGRSHQTHCDDMIGSIS
jgi:hypothetical protein